MRFSCGRSWMLPDGNGRMGRLWQTLILTRWNPLFATVPVESLIHATQSDYYRAIRESSAAGESTRFIEYMLDTNLVPALKSGYIEMTRPDAPSAANQKYRLTQLGRRARAK